MRNRLYRVFAMAMMVVLLLSSMNLTASAAYSSTGSGNSFTLINMSGLSISEVYFYPAHNSTWGNARNRGWIYNGNEGKISFTSAEMRLNTEWAVRIGFNKGRSVSYALWEDLTLSDFIDAGTVFVTANENGGYTIDFGGGDLSVEGNTCTLLNMTGLSITEVYFYPISNSVWGDCRNKSWVYNGDEVEVRFTDNELMLDVEWCMRLGFNMGRSVSYVYWDGLSLEDFVNSEYVTVMTEDDGYIIYFEE